MGARNSEHAAESLVGQIERGNAGSLMHLLGCDDVLKEAAMEVVEAILRRASRCTAAGEYDSLRRLLAATVRAASVKEMRVLLPEQAQIICVGHVDDGRDNNAYDMLCELVHACARHSPAVLSGTYPSLEDIGVFARLWLYFTCPTWTWCRACITCAVRRYIGLFAALEPIYPPAEKFYDCREALVRVFARNSCLWTAGDLADFPLVLDLDFCLRMLSTGVCFDIISDEEFLSGSVAHPVPATWNAKSVTVFMKGAGTYSLALRALSYHYCGVPHRRPLFDSLKLSLVYSVDFLYVCCVSAATPFLVQYYSEQENDFSACFTDVRAVLACLRAATDSALRFHGAPFIDEQLCRAPFFLRYLLALCTATYVTGEHSAPATVCAACSEPVDPCSSVKDAAGYFKEYRLAAADVLKRTVTQCVRGGRARQTLLGFLLCELAEPTRDDLSYVEGSAGRRAYCQRDQRASCQIALITECQMRPVRAWLLDELRRAAAAHRDGTGLLDDALCSVFRHCTCAPVSPDADGGGADVHGAIVCLLVAVAVDGRYEPVFKRWAAEIGPYVDGLGAALERRPQSAKSKHSEDAAKWNMVLMNVALVKDRLAML